MELGDIFILTEFIGFVLLSTIKGKKIMLVIGKDGEGRTRMGFEHYLVIVRTQAACRKWGLAVYKDRLQMGTFNDG